MEQRVNYHGSNMSGTGTLVNGLGPNLYAIKRDDGLYVSMDRNGNIKTSETMGAWEGNFKLSDKTNILTITPNVVTYNLEISEA